MKFFIKTFSAIILLSTVILIACKKNNVSVDKDYIQPQTASEFLLDDLGMPQHYSVQDKGPKFAIPVGFTNLSTSDRTIYFTYTSRTGATKGVEYFAPDSVVVKAGKSLDSLRIGGDYAFYSSSAKIDTIGIKISGGNFKPVYKKDSITLEVERYCEIDFLNIEGPFDETRYLTPNGLNVSRTAFRPALAGTTGIYSTGVFGMTQDLTNSKLATGLMQTIYGGSNDLTFSLNWTNPNKFFVTMPMQEVGGVEVSSGGTPVPLAIRSSPSRPSTFLSCQRIFTLYVDWYDAAVDTLIARNYQIIMK
jgi:hypothetical protein